MAGLLQANELVIGQVSTLLKRSIFYKAAIERLSEGRPESQTEGNQSTALGRPLSTQWLDISAQLSNGATETLKKVKKEQERKG